MRMASWRTLVKNMERTRNFPEIAALRRKHRNLRDNMTGEQVGAMSRAICERLLASEVYRQADTIYAYYPLGREVSPLAVIERALADGKVLAFPRVGESCGMDFYRVTSLSQLAEGSFHVMEPVLECPMLQKTRALVLVPGLAFDRQGNRYGYGKGYYDRYFARFPGLTRVALAYEHQMEEAMEVLPTDVKMHRIETECGSYIISREV